MSEGKEMVVAREVPLQMTTVSADKYGHVEAAKRAEIQTRTTVALARPRDPLDVRAKMLAAAQRPKFAEQAEYALPRSGKTIVGATIRFAEECKRAMGNLICGIDVIHDDADLKIVRVSIADMEVNNYDYQDITITKTMERKQPKDSDEILSKRTNSSGQTVYTVVCPEGELAVKQAAQVARVKRNLILQATPGDIIEEALAEARHTCQNRDAKDPAGATKRIADAFADDLRVTPSDLAKYLGHPLSQCSPMELDDLRGIYSALKDGDTTWSQIIGERIKPEGSATEKATAKVQEALAGQKEKRAYTKRTPVSDAVKPAIEIEQAAKEARERKEAGLVDDYGESIPTPPPDRLDAIMANAKKAPTMPKPFDAEPPSREPGGDDTGLNDPSM